MEKKEKVSQQATDPDELTYDVHFNDMYAGNNEGWHISYDECMRYIWLNNGTNEGYFADYKGGMVSIVCNETGETVYETPVL